MAGATYADADLVRALLRPDRGGRRDHTRARHRSLPPRVHGGGLASSIRATGARPRRGTAAVGAASEAHGRRRTSRASATNCSRCCGRSVTPARPADARRQVIAGGVDRRPIPGQSSSTAKLSPVQNPYPLHGAPSDAQPAAHHARSGADHRRSAYRPFGPCRRRAASRRIRSRGNSRRRRARGELRRAERDRDDFDAWTPHPRIQPILEAADLGHLRAVNQRPALLHLRGGR